MLELLLLFVFQCLYVSLSYWFYICCCCLDTRCKSAFFVYVCSSYIFFLLFSCQIVWPVFAGHEWGRRFTRVNISRPCYRVLVLQCVWFFTVCLVLQYISRFSAYAWFSGKFLVLQCMCVPQLISVFFSVWFFSGFWFFIVCMVLCI